MASRTLLVFNTNLCHYGSGNEYCANAIAREVLVGLLVQDESDEQIVGYHYRPTTYRPSRLFRDLYFALLLGLWALFGIWVCFRVSTPDVILLYTSSSLVNGLFHFIFLTFTIIICGFYFVRGQTTSTILPCVSHLLYKVCSVLLVLFMTTTFILSAVETNRKTCGGYTSERIPPPHLGTLTA
jgi:hypothetical protein